MAVLTCWKSVGYEVCLLNKLRAIHLESMGNRAVSAKNADILCAKITLGTLEK